MGSGGETEYDDAGLRIAEARDRTPPVGLVLEGSPLLPGYLLAPGDEARASTTGDDLPF